MKNVMQLSKEIILTECLVNGNMFIAKYFKLHMSTFNTFLDIGTYNKIEKCLNDSNRSTIYGKGRMCHCRNHSNKIILTENREYHHLYSISVDN